MHQKGGGMNGHQLALQNSMKPKSSQSVTGKLHRLERCFLDWTTAVVGEADMCQPYLPQQWSNLRSIVPIYEVYRYI